MLPLESFCSPVLDFGGLPGFLRLGLLDVEGGVSKTEMETNSLSLISWTANVLLLVDLLRTGVSLSPSDPVAAEEDSPLRKLSNMIWCLLFFVGGVIKS